MSAADGHGAAVGLRGLVPFGVGGVAEPVGYGHQTFGRVVAAAENGIL